MCVNIFIYYSTKTLLMASTKYIIKMISLYYYKFPYRHFGHPRFYSATRRKPFIDRYTEV